MTHLVDPVAGTLSCTTTFIGKRIDVLRRAGGSFQVLRRTIYLDQSVLLARNLTTFF